MICGLSLRRQGLVAGLVFAGALVLSMPTPAQVDPKAPPAGNRRDPGLFGNGTKRDKKDKDDDENTRAVAGRVSNESGNLIEGAVVQLKDMKSLKVRSYITKADGVYKFFGLSTNADYEIRGGAPGLESDKRTLSIFDSRREAIVNLTLEPQKKSAEKEPAATAAAK